MIDYHHDYYRGLAKLYFLRIVDTIIRLGRLRNEKGLILDFGCGFQYLKKRLRQPNIVGYDLIKELSDVKDYRRLKPAVIVCNNVLEHFSLADIEKLLKQFRKMNASCTLVTAIPTENFLSKIGMVITGQRDAHADHKSSLADITTLLSRYCVLLRRRRLFTLSEIAVWRFHPLVLGETFL
mgnify:CR=1 FL=1